MIEESYVSFDTAKLLKEAGFDVPCFNQYTDRGTVWHCDCPENFNKSQCATSCPTQALAERWLREVHHYAVCVWYSAEHEKWFYAHGNLDNMMFDEEYSISDFIYDSYEQALEAGLKEAIKMIKNKDYEEDNVQR